MTPGFKPKIVIFEFLIRVVTVEFTSKDASVGFEPTSVTIYW